MTPVYAPVHRCDVIYGPLLQLPWLRMKIIKWCRKKQLQKKHKNAHIYHQVTIPTRLSYRFLPHPNRRGSSPPRTWTSTSRAAIEVEHLNACTCRSQKPRVRFVGGNGNWDGILYLIVISNTIFYELLYGFWHKWADTVILWRGAAVSVDKWVRKLAPKLIYPGFKGGAGFHDGLD